MKQVDSNLPLLGNKCSFLLRLHPGFSFSGITHVQLPIASSESPNMAALVAAQTRLCSIWEAACVRLLPASLCLFSFNTAGPNSERSWKSLRGSLGRLDSASSRLCESFLAFVPADRWVIVWHIFFNLDVVLIQIKPCSFRLMFNSALQFIVVPRLCQRKEKKL